VMCIFWPMNAFCDRYIFTQIALWAGTMSPDGLVLYCLDLQTWSD
jgi:hypothetical protein